MTETAFNADRVVPEDVRKNIDEHDYKVSNLFFHMLHTWYGDKMKDWDAIDMFARDGRLTVQHYVGAVKSLDLWEFNPEHEQALKDWKCGDVRIGDSFELMKDNTKQYDLLIVDAPQSQYPGGGQLQFEHFGFMPNMQGMMKDKCVIVFYINKRPYNRDVEGDFGNDSYTTYDYDAWMAERSKFYSSPADGSLTEEQALVTYRAMFKRMGFTMTKVFLLPCYDGMPGLNPGFRIAVEVSR